MPILKNENYFEFSMKAVVSAQQALVDKIQSKEIYEIDDTFQQNENEIRYSKNIEFTDQIAGQFLKRNLDNYTLKGEMSLLKKPKLVRHIYL